MPSLSSILSQLKWILVCTLFASRFIFTINLSKECWNVARMECWVVDFRVCIHLNECLCAILVCRSFKLKSLIRISTFNCAINKWDFSGSLIRLTFCAECHFTCQELLTCEMSWFQFNSCLGIPERARRLMINPGASQFSLASLKESTRIRRLESQSLKCHSNEKSVKCITRSFVLPRRALPEVRFFREFLGRISRH